MRQVDSISVGTNAFYTHMIFAPPTAIPDLLVPAIHKYSLAQIVLSSNDSKEIPRYAH